MAHAEGNMEKRLLSPFKALRTLRKNPALLQSATAGITNNEARLRRDGADGWNVLFIVCHLRDYEIMVAARVEAMLMYDQPTFSVTSNDEQIAKGDYAHQSFEAVLADLFGRRSALLTQLEMLTPEQWQRPGYHPEQGAATVLDVAINAALHDIDHIEQITRCR